MASARLNCHWRIRIYCCCPFELEDGHPASGADVHYSYNKDVGGIDFARTDTYARCRLFRVRLRLLHSEGLISTSR